VNITVQDVLTSITSAGDRSVQWYLNFLAGQTVQPGSAVNLLTPREAACVWAGVSVANYGLIGALNVKAGITDPSNYVTANKALNFIKYSTTNPNSCRPWLTNQQALLAICLAV
jgi:hypothetical protein